MPDELKKGQQVVVEHCVVCHEHGLRGAPMIGRYDMWAPRTAKGEDVLLNNAINGLNMMPPRGGNPNLTNDEILYAVRYMLRLSSKP